MAQDNGTNCSSVNGNGRRPWWMAILFSVIEKPQLFSIVFATALLGAFMGWIPSPVLSIVSEHQVLTEQIRKQQVEALDTKETLIRTLAYQTALLRAICYRLSPTPIERVQCEPR